MGVTARDIMSEAVVTASPEMPVEELMKLLAEKRISGVPVVDDLGQVVGIATEADVLAARPGQTTVGSIMTRDVVGVSADESLEEIAFLLSARRINRVPVLEEGKLVGIISRADIVRALASRASSAEAETGASPG